MIDGFVIFLLGLASLLSGIIRLLLLFQHKTMVAAQFARAVDVCTLAGLSSVQEVQDRFGPATLDGTWPSITLAEIHSHMQPLGFIVGRQWPNYAAIGLALIAPFFGSDLIKLAIVIVFILQVIGWSFTARLSSP